MPSYGFRPGLTAYVLSTSRFPFLPRESDWPGSLLRWAIGHRSPLAELAQMTFPAGLGSREWDRPG